MKSMTQEGILNIYTDVYITTLEHVIYEYYT